MTEHEHEHEHEHDHPREAARDGETRDEADTIEANGAAAEAAPDPDTEAILSRRRFLIQSTLAGVGIAVGDAACQPRPRTCLMPVSPDDRRHRDGGATTIDTAPADAGASTSSPDAGATSTTPPPASGPKSTTRPKPKPQPCLGPPAPKPCLKRKPKPQPCLKRRR